MRRKVVTAMADNKPQTPPVDPDAPTEQSVKQTLAQLPTWEEWLAQNQFIKGEKHRSAISAVEWNRDFPKFGRGWRLRVAPSTDTINIIVYNATLGRKVNQIAMVSVGERSVVNILTKLITEIERPVSDVTKKRRIRAITSAIPYEEREEKPEFINGPVMTPDNIQQLRNLGLMRQEAGPIRRPVPDDPDELNPAQFDQLLNRLQVRCFQKGQRVRIRTPRHTRLNGELGTVVDAGPHSCYVAIDSYVEAGDPDPFRFEEQELEPVYESIENVDDPEPYMDALDYVTPLKELGYRLLNGAYTKSLLLGEQVAGYLRIKVHPRAAGVIVYIDYQAHGEMEHIAEMSASAIETIDLVREIEQMAADAKTASEFTAKMRERQFPNTVVVGQEDHLYYLFGESMLEAAEQDPDPEAYLQELGRHYDVINAFREHGVKMRRRMRADHPYYEMFWYPDASMEVTYDLFIQPDGQGWAVSARGQKRFDTDNWGSTEEEFEIDHAWYITTDKPEEIAAQVDDILSALREYTGPDELTPIAPDYDDIDESVDEIGDYEAYAKASAGWNPVRMLTSKQIRQFVREAGFKVSTIYRSRVDQGWAVTATPATAQAFEVFQQNPHRMAEFMEHTAREAIKKLMPNLAKIERGMYNLDDKLYVHAWEWSGSTSADPSNPNNWVIYLDIRPSDYQKYRRGGIKEAEDDPDEVKDIVGYAKGTNEPVKILQEFGYVYNQQYGSNRWNKYWDLPQPAQTKKDWWTPTYTKIWGSPDIHGQFVWGLIDPASPNSKATGYIIVKPLNRISGIDDWDIATSIRRMLLQVENLMRNIPATNDPDVLRNWLATEMERIKEDVNKQADATWVDEAAVLPEAVVDPDDPEQMIAQHQPLVYSLYGQYANYDNAVSFGTYTTLEDAIRGALERHLHEEYEYVWIEEATVDTLADWDTAKVKLTRLTGVKYIVNADGTTKTVKMPVELYNRPPHKIRESEDVDDPELYIQTTFDPRQFLEQYNWQTYKHEAYEYWHKDYPLPHSYYLGGMRFNIVRLVIGFDLRWRGAYSCTVQTFWASRPEPGEDWVDMTKASMPGNNWSLLQQRVYPEQEDEPDDFTDANMPLRRFVMGIDRVMAGIAWPDSDAALVANVELERALAGFIHELNDVAEAPIYDQYPMEEARVPKDKDFQKVT